MNGQVCKLTDCMYLHEVAEEEASFTKEDMQKQKHSEYEKSLMDAFIRKQRQRQDNELKVICNLIFKHWYLPEHIYKTLNQMI